jgi:hypothetical protein
VGARPRGAVGDVGGVRIRPSTRWGPAPERRPEVPGEAAQHARQPAVRSGPAATAWRGSSPCGSPSRGCRTPPSTSTGTRSKRTRVGAKWSRLVRQVYSSRRGGSTTRYSPSTVPRSRSRRCPTLHRHRLGVPSPSRGCGTCRRSPTTLQLARVGQRPEHLLRGGCDLHLLVHGGLHGLRIRCLHDRSRLGSRSGCVRGRPPRGA